MSIVTRLTFVLAVCVVLPACSSNMTRFNFPALGMKQNTNPEVGYRDQDSKSYSQKNYKQSDYNKQTFNRKNDGRSDYSQYEYDKPNYKQSVDRNGYNPDRYKTDRKYNQYAQDQYSQKSYETNRYKSADQFKSEQKSQSGYQPKKLYSDGRDVYDTKSTLNNRRDYNDRFQKRGREDFGRKDEASLRREQLPKLDQPTRKVTTYRYVPRNAQKNSDYQQPRRVANSGQHVVVEGDTLYNISRRYNVSSSEIRRENGLDGSGIKLGQRLTIPGVGKTQLDKISQLSAKKNIPSQGLKAGDKYKVKSGDTIYSIARRSGVSAQTLADSNGLSDVGQVRLGQVLIIPGQEKISRPIRVASIDRKAGLNKVKRTQVPTPVRKKKVSRNKIKSVDTGISKSLAGKHRFMWPVGGRILSKFGRQKSGTINDGVNLSVPAGTKVKAAEGGVVAYAGSELKGYGNLVLVRHKNNWVSAYAHNSKLLVKRGDKVRRGQIIAKSGKTGSVHQPQLHFELRRGSKPVNPMKYLAMR